jgi:chromosome segregation ATPase
MISRGGTRGGSDAPVYSEREVEARVFAERVRVEKDFAAQVAALREERDALKRVAGPAVAARTRAELVEARAVGEKLRTQRDAYAAAVQRAAARIRELEGAGVESGKKGVDELEGELATARARVVELIEEAERREEEEEHRKRDGEAEREGLREEVAALRAERALHEERMVALEGEAERLRGEVVVRVGDLESVHGELVEAVRGRDASQAAEKAARQDLERILESFRLAKARKDEEMQALQSEIRSAQADAAERATREARALEAVERLKGKILELAAQVDALRAENETLRTGKLEAESRAEERDGEARRARSEADGRRAEAFEAQRAANAHRQVGWQHHEHAPKGYVGKNLEACDAQPRGKADRRG